jgi:hypothetical protein
MNCVVITGSRDWTDAAAIEKRLEAEPPDTVFIEGGARGADAVCRFWCSLHNRNHIRVDANWEYYGNSAGVIRNGWMLDMRPRLVIAFWRNNSRGTADCIHQAEALGIPVEKHIR